MPHERPTHKSSQESSPVPTVASSIQALDAKLKLIAQRMKILENNEQVMGRTIISINKKIKEIESIAAAPGGGKVDLTEIKKNLKEELKSELTTELISPPLSESAQSSSPRPILTPSSDLTEIKNELQKLKERVDEMDYVVKSMNPLEYVSVEQIGEIINRKIDERLK